MDMASPTLLTIDDADADALRAAVAAARETLRAQRDLLPSALYSRKRGLLDRAAATLSRRSPSVRFDDVDALHALLEDLVADRFDAGAA